MYLFRCFRSEIPPVQYFKEKYKFEANNATERYILP